MLTKLTSKNQITIPKDVLSKLPKVQYFEVEYKEGVILLKPVKVYDTDLGGIREKIKKLGISEECEHLRCLVGGGVKSHLIGLQGFLLLLQHR